MKQALDIFTQASANGVGALGSLRRALRRDDQSVFDELLALARGHVLAADPAPLAEMFLTLLLAEYQESLRLRQVVEQVKVMEAPFRDD